MPDSILSNARREPKKDARPLGHGEHDDCRGGTPDGIFFGEPISWLLRLSLPDEQHRSRR